MSALMPFDLLQNNLCFRFHLQPSPTESSTVRALTRRFCLLAPENSRFAIHLRSGQALRGNSEIAAASRNPAGTAHSKSVWTRSSDSPPLVPPEPSRSMPGRVVVLARLAAAQILPNTRPRSPADRPSRATDLPFRIPRPLQKRWPRRPHAPIATWHHLYR